MTKWRATPEQAKEYDRRHRLAKKRYVDEVKAAEGCRDCGEDDPVVLDLHHRDPTTKSQILKRRSGSLLILSWPNLRAELALCDVLCANCHRRLHHKEQS